MAAISTHPANFGAVTYLSEDVTLGQLSTIAVDYDAVVMHGTRDEIEAVAARMRLGDRELRNRSTRRRMQRESRRKNR